MSAFDFFKKQGPIKYIKSVFDKEPEETGMRFKVGEGLDEQQKQRAEEVVRKKPIEKAPERGGAIDFLSSIGKALPDIEGPFEPMERLFVEPAVEFVKGVAKTPFIAGKSIARAVVGDKKEDDRPIPLLGEIDSIQKRREEAEKLPGLNFFDKVDDLKDKPQQLVPFVASADDAVKFGGLLSAANRLKEDKATEEDVKLLQAYVDKNSQDTSFGYKVLDTLSYLPSFAGELYATGGVATAGRALTRQTAKEVLEKLLTKSGKELLEKKSAQFGIKVVSEVGARTLQSPFAGATRIASGTLEKQLQGTLGEVAGEGEKEDLWMSATKSFGEQWVETVSEFSGGVLAPLSRPVKNKLLRTALFSSLKKANTGAKADDLAMILNKIGYNGILGEMFEERVADVGHGTLYEIGLGDQKFSLPSGEQLAVELASFSVPGVAISVIDQIDPTLNKTRDLLKSLKPGLTIEDVSKNLEPISKVIIDKKLSKEQFVNQFNAGLSNQDLAIKEEAEKNLKEIEKSKMTIESFYDSVVNKKTEKIKEDQKPRDTITDVKKEEEKEPVKEEVEMITHGAKVDIEQILEQGFIPGKKTIKGEAAYFTDNETTRGTYGDRIIKINPADFNIKEFKTLEEEDVFVEEQGSKNLSDAVREEGKFDGFVLLNKHTDVGNTYGITNLEKFNEVIRRDAGYTPTKVEAPKKDGIPGVKGLKKVGLAPKKEVSPSAKVAQAKQAPTGFVTKSERALLKDKIKNIQKLAISEANKKSKIQQLRNEFQLRQEKAVRKAELAGGKNVIIQRFKALSKGLREGKTLTRSEISKTQTEIIDILDKSRLDRNDKAKFIRAIKNVQTKEQLEKTLPIIQERIETLETKSDKRTLKANIKKELENTKIKKEAGKPVGKFTPEIQETLNIFRLSSLLSKSEAEMKTQFNIEKYKDTVPPESVALENKILSMISGLEEMSVEELKSILAKIKYIKRTGVLTSELKKFNRQSDIDDWTNKTIDIITGGKGLPENISTIGTRELDEKTLEKRVQKFMGTIGKEFVGWNDIIDMLARKTKDKPGNTWLDKFSNVTDQENKVKEGQRKYLGGEGIGRKITEEAFDIKSDHQIIKLFKNDAKEVSLGKFRNANGNISDIIYTKSEARKAWMELQDPTLEKTFREGMGYTNEIIDAIDNFLTKQDKDFAKKQLDFYKKYYDGVNEIYGDIYGVNLPKNEFYSPIKRAGIDRGESVGFGEFLQEVSIRKSVTSGSLKSRVRNIKPLEKQSDIAVLEQHISEMEHFKAWSKKMRDLNAVFGNTEVRTAIKREHGKGMLAMVDNFLRDFTRGGIETASRLNWLDKLRGNFSRAVLGIKPAIMIKQFTSFIAYADSIPAKDFMIGFADFWTGPRSKVRTLRRSEMMKARGSNMERDIKTAVKSDAYSSFRKNPSFLNALMLNIQIGDQGAIFAGGWPVYRYHRKQGKSHDEALRAFEDVTSSTQQSADLSKLSYIQRAGSFAKLFTMFMSSPNQYFRKEMGAIRNLIHGRGTVKQHAKTISIYHFILPMLFQYVSDGFEWDEEEQTRAAIFGPFNGIFIVSDGLENLIRKALGLREFSSEIPIYGISDDLGKAIKLIADDEITTEDIFEAVRGLAGAVGSLKGVPLKTSIDMASGLVDTLEGKYEQGLAKFLGWSPYVAEKIAKPTHEKILTKSSSETISDSDTKQFRKSVREGISEGKISVEEASDIVDKFISNQVKVNAKEAFKKTKNASSKEKAKILDKLNEDELEEFFKLLDKSLENNDL